MGFITDTLKSFADDIWENRGRILTGVSCLGTLSTFIFTLRANTKANERRHEAQAEKGEYLTAWERVKAEGPVYILPGLICLSTMGVTVLCQIDHENVVEKMSVAIAALSKMHYDRLKAEKAIGVDQQVNAELVEHVDRNDIPEGYKKYCLYGRVFYARPEDIYRGEIAINKELNYNHYVNMYVFVKAVNSDTFPIIDEDNITGWSTWHVPHDSICSPVYVQVIEIDQGLWTELVFDFEPETGYFGY